MKFRLLLLDANVVIYLHEIGLWSQIVSECEVILSRTVMDSEAKYFEAAGRPHPINLKPLEDNGEITVVEMDRTEIIKFKQRFDPIYLERLDPGEAESLAYLDQAEDVHLICSSDGIVFRTLALLDRVDQGISLEEILNRLGRSRKVDHQYTRAFRDQFTSVGLQDRMQDRGLR